MGWGYSSLYDFPFFFSFAVRFCLLLPLTVSLFLFFTLNRTFLFIIIYVSFLFCDFLQVSITKRFHEDCDTKVSEFKLQSRYDTHFQTDTDILIPQMKSNNNYCTSIMAFGIKCPTKIDMPFNKETEPKLLWLSWLGLQNTPTASLQRGKTLPTRAPVHVSKQSDDEDWRLEIGGKRNISLSPLPQIGSTWLDIIYSSNRTKLCTYAKLNSLK